ncbi:hypothetical protein M758_7G159600 [Ceratodon purpureus]|nr:hypothetical protein KC19_N015100 [Ceratodon purpureus]KAG0611702.1 hypothetical protein M758_7G159600 [Ceratodon purpureus]
MPSISICSLLICWSWWSSTPTMGVIDLKLEHGTWDDQKLLTLENRKSGTLKVF